MLRVAKQPHAVVVQAHNHRQRCHRDVDGREIYPKIYCGGGGSNSDGNDGGSGTEW